MSHPAVAEHMCIFGGLHALSESSAGSAPPLRVRLAEMFLFRNQTPPNLYRQCRTSRLLRMARLRRRTAINMAVSALFLLALGTARGDLTGRLVDDSDTMANIVGASETQSLVDFKLHKVRRGSNSRAYGKAKACGYVPWPGYNLVWSLAAVRCSILHQLRLFHSLLPQLNSCW